MSFSFKNKFKKNFTIRKNFWTILLVILVSYLVYQVGFAWEKEEVIQYGESFKSDDEVVFITVKEKHHGVKRTGFKSLNESLKIWEHDQKNDVIWVKFDTLLPSHKPKVKIMVIYDRNLDSVQKYSEIFSVSTFPYQYYFNNAPFISFYHVDENGTIYLNFEGKRIKLAPNSPYYSFSIEGYQSIETEIRNHGIYKKNQFKSFEERDSSDKYTRFGLSSKTYLKLYQELLDEGTVIK